MEILKKETLGLQVFDEVVIILSVLDVENLHNLPRTVSHMLQENEQYFIFGQEMDELLKLDGVRDSVY